MAHKRIKRRRAARLAVVAANCDGILGAQALHYYQRRGQQLRIVTAAESPKK